MVRQARLIAVVVVFVIAVVMAGCGGGPGNIEGPDSQRGAATNEEATAPEGDRPTAETAQEPAALDAKVVSPGQAYVPAGFGEGSLWTTVSDPSDPSAACDDVNVKTVGSASASSEALCAAEPAKTLLKRVDPRTGEVVAEIPLERRLSNLDLFTQVAFGAGSVWVSSGYYDMGPAMERQPGDVVLRIDPRTNQIVDRIPVDPPSGLAFGHGSVWATSAGYGTLSRIDPQTGEVVAKIEVGRGAVDIAADESSGAMWVASVFLPKDPGGYDLPEYSEDRNLTRVDPATNRVVAEIPIRAGSPTGGAQNVAVGEGAVWVQSGDGKLFKVDPATNEVIAMVSVGDSTCVGPTCVGPSSALAVYGGAVWAMVQASSSPGTRLVRVDPRTEQVVAEDIGPISKVGIGFVAAGGGYVWFSSGEGLARVSP